MARRFIDIGANLTDSMYTGTYHGSKKHNPDLTDVLGRAWDQGLNKIIITGGSLEDSREALKLAKSNEKLYSTVGCHPTKCEEFEKTGDPETYFKGLSDLIKEGKPKVVAIGECGLDYDRLNFCSKEIQLKYFEKQLSLSKTFDMPLFLHCRNAADDLLEILSRHKDLRGGVVHSFDGTLDEAKRIMDLGFYIGINGCSLKTQQNLDVAKRIPTDRLMMETDCPWCEIKPTHAGSGLVKTKFPSLKKEKWHKGSMVKGRTEPANIIQVAEILASIKGVDLDSLCSQIFQNTEKLFFSTETNF